MERNFAGWKKLFFFALFAGLVLAAGRANFSALVGAEGQYFTFFQFFGPVAGAFIGPIAGAGAVLAAELAEFFFAGKAIELINIARLFPMLFAAYYFGRFVKNRKADASIAIPIIAMAAFVLHPIGREVWFFSLFWLIPIIARVFSKNLFLRSLGATFTAHAVGGAIWIWTVPMTAAAWVALIPIVIFERTLFAAGISVSFIAFTTVLEWFEARFKTGAVHIEENYTLGRLFKVFS